MNLQPVNAARPQRESLIKKDGRVYCGMSTDEYLEKFGRVLTKGQAETMKRLQREGKTA